MRNKAKKIIIAMMSFFFIIANFSVVSVQAAVKTADEYYNLYKQYTQNQPYDALKLLVEANSNYPNDVRFIDGINEKSKTIVEWSMGSHMAGHYDSAINGYDTILKVSVVNDGIKNFAQKQKSQAQSNKLPVDANQYNALAIQYNSYQPYDALKVLSEAIVGYPNDKRFIDGIKDRTNTIFEWSLGSHESGHFDAALYGYQTIMNTLTANIELKSKVATYISYAKSGKVVYSASRYNSIASPLIQTQPYEALRLYSEAITLYSSDNTIKDGVVKSAKTILEWSLGSHRAGNYDAAAYGYQKVLDAPVFDYLKSYAQKQKDRADSKQAPLSSQDYNSQINNLSDDKPYDKLKLSSEAIIMYPTSNTYKAYITNASSTILSWSLGSHRAGNFDAALYGYQKIIEAPSVNDYLYNGATRQKNQALRSVYPLTLSDYNKMQIPDINTTPYNAINFFSEIYSMFNDSNAKTKLNQSAAVILDWSKGSHKIGNCDAAIYGYDVLINNTYVNSQVYGVANALRAIAEKGIAYSDDGKYVVNSKYNMSFNQMIDDQMQNGGPLVYQSGSGWVPAQRSDVEYYANPTNYMTGNSVYQFLVLSGQAGVSVDDLNSLLNDKGTLKGTAASFIEASRKYNINEIYLVSHSLLETGNGTSKLAQGVLYNNKIVYNMFGVGAYDKPFYPTDTTANPTAWGAKYAYDNGWFTPEAAIIGGAKFIGNGYINNGQDTLYKMRWNPNNPSHQYATDVGWAVKQISRIKDLYDKTKNFILRFDIPVYN